MRSGLPETHASPLLPVERRHRRSRLRQGARLGFGSGGSHADYVGLNRKHHQFSGLSAAGNPVEPRRFPICPTDGVPHRRSGPSPLRIEPCAIANRRCKGGGIFFLSRAVLTRLVPLLDSPVAGLSASNAALYQSTVLSVVLCSVFSLGALRFVRRRSTLLRE